MYFRNLKAYRLDDAWRYTADELNALLAAAAFVPCSKSAMRSTGWVPPRGNPEEYVVTVAGQQLIALCIETKLLPANVVRQHVQARCEKLEAAQGYKPGRRQMKEIKEQVTEELIPKAFSIFRDTRIWIDPVNRWLLIDTTSSARADEVIGALSKSLDAFPLDMLRLAKSPAQSMTTWLAADEAPAGFSIDQDTELKDTGESKAAVRYVRQSIEADAVKKHIDEGKQCTRLAMTWDDRVSFMLTEPLALKRITPLDVVREGEGDTSFDDARQKFDSDFTLMAGELSRLLGDLVEALGGEQQLEGAAPAGDAAKLAA